MTQAAGRVRRSSFIVLLLIAGGLAIRLIPTITASWAQNEQALALNRFQRSEAALGTILVRAINIRDAGNFDYRNAGYRYLAAGNRELAVEAFLAAGWDAHDFAAMAEHTYNSDPDRAIAWLALAAAAAPDDLRLLSRLGQRCRFDWNRDAACLQFLAQNGDNRFVNPDFAVADLDGWQQIDAPAHYSMESCPDTPTTTCALIQVNADSSVPPAGLGQCFQVEAGTTYLYAVWLKVMTTSNGTWRPLYFQGIIDGQARGNWQENEQGSSDWRYWERTFVAQSFDDGQACFHPIRLQGGGQAWFYGAKVIALTENP